MVDAGAVVKRAQALAIVGNPPWTAGRAGDSPGIDEIGVGNRGYARSVGHKIHLGVMLGIAERPDGQTNDTALATEYNAVFIN